MRRLLLFLTFFFFLGTSVPSSAAVYTSGNIFLFSGLAHTAFKRIDTPFAGWSQPIFRPLTADREGFSRFLSEVRSIFLATGFARDPVLPRRSSRPNDEVQSWDRGTIIPLQIKGSAQTGNEFDVFLGINLRRILTQLFSTVFSIKYDIYVETRAGRYAFTDSRFSGATSRNRELDEKSNLALIPGGGRTWIPTSKDFRQWDERLVTPAPVPLDDEDRFLFRVWRMRIINTMTNPVVLFGLVVAGLISFAWRIRHATSP
jgi:hypothetical protein